ncbi:hypothetical protein PENTCL1PPCAC_19833, partial [Pristionchus entomophagus]
EKEEEEDDGENSRSYGKEKKKSWPVMDYSLPSERNKPTREERKLQADLERLAKMERMTESTNLVKRASQNFHSKESTKKDDSDKMRMEDKGEKEEDDNSLKVKSPVVGSTETGRMSSTNPPSSQLCDETMFDDIDSD